MYSRVFCGSVLLYVLTLTCTVCGILKSLASSPSSMLELLPEDGCSRLPCLSRRGRSRSISMATRRIRQADQRSKVNAPYDIQRNEERFPSSTQ
ncbi:hypothetical protein ElyMa_004542600 [Elysia marginata]|uniref:Secreted protein n=1 Tax=Elysia marginata TaxID=1093978 RepID=A0AAV4HQH8_9GAST|nr:hypothetical protein ElyMa_004542600 [Elysia marginata]